MIIVSGLPLSRLHVSLFFFFSSRRRHTRCSRDWSSDVCSSDLIRVYLPVLRSSTAEGGCSSACLAVALPPLAKRSEEHTSELQSRLHLVCRLLLEKKKHRVLGPPLPAAFHGTSMQAVRFTGCVC